MRSLAPSLVFAACVAGAACAARDAPAPYAGGPGPDEDASTLATTCGDLRVAGAACAQCVSAACCDPARACGADAPCAAFSACLAGCGADAACRASCAVEGDRGVPARWPAVGACRASSCASACGAGCGAELAFADATCGACVRSACCAQAAACASDLACARLSACLFGCVADPACRASCRVDFADGAAKLAALDDCATGGECAVPCSAPDLSCVGSVKWASGEAGSFGVQVRYEDVQTKQPVVGLEVSACSRYTVACGPTTAAATAISDADGVAGWIMERSELAWMRVDGPPGTLPGLLFFRPPFVSTTFFGLQMYPLADAIRQMGSAAVIDPEAAQLHVFVVDCRGRPFAGATVEVAVGGVAQPVVYSRVDATPDPTMTETGLAGEARALNVAMADPDGYPLADVTVRRASDGLFVAHTSVRLHAGRWSELFSLGPTPAGE